MIIKVVIVRKFRQDSYIEAHKAITEIRSLATLQHGYISGETLICQDDPTKLMAISTWMSRQHWEKWRASPTRQDATNILDAMLEVPEQVECYLVGEKVSAWTDMD